MSPLGTTVSLLVTFEKARYPTYPIHVTEMLFRTPSEFHQWEAANELLHLLLLSHHRDYEQLQPFLEKNVQLITEAACNRIRRIVDTLIHGKNKITLKAFIRTLLLVMSSLIHLLQSRSTDLHRPAFLSMMEAGYLLVSACHAHISTLEKEPHKDYELTVLMLRLMLASPYSPNRRGKWYRRLSIDLDVHLKNDMQAIQCLKTSLKDPFVKVPHAIDFVFNDTVSWETKTIYNCDFSG